MTLTAPPDGPAVQKPRHGEHAFFWAVVPAGLTFLAAVMGHRYAVDAAVGLAVAWAVTVCVALSVHKGGPVTPPVIAGAALGLAWGEVSIFLGPWHRQNLVVLGVGTVALWGWLWVAMARHESWLEEMARRDAERNRRLDRLRWPRLLAQIGFPGLTTVDIEEPRPGLIVTRLRLPRDGKVTFRRLKESVEQLEVAAELRPGAINFHQDLDRSHEVLLHIAETDVLAQEIPFPGDTTNLTINRPFPIGARESGSDWDVLLREVATYVVGLRGMGKSNFINVVVAQLARCVDVVIFMIDCKGGRTAVPWIRPWLEGKSERPVIDWVATNREEAEVMLRACVRGYKDRAERGAGHAEKITPDARQPAIILIIEEMAFVFAGIYSPSFDIKKPGQVSNNKLAHLGTELVEGGRSEAIDPILVTRRGTVDSFGDSMLKQQCGLRIGLGVTQDSEVQYILGQSLAAKVLARLRWPGCGVSTNAFNPDEPAVPGKVYRITTEQIYSHALACGDRRPAPDPDLTDALGQEYVSRWTRFPRKILDSMGVQPRPGWAKDKLAAAQSDQAIFDRMAAEFGEGPQGSPARAAMIQFLHERGIRGAAPYEIEQHLKATGLQVHRTTIHDWLNQEISAGRIAKPDSRVPLYKDSAFVKPAA